MKCNKSQMATLTMWKIFMALLLAMALLMPLTLARLHSTSGVGMSGGSSSMGPGGGSGSGGTSSKDSHGKSTSIPIFFFDYFKWLWLHSGSKPESPINKFKYLTNLHSECGTTRDFHLVGSCQKVWEEKNTCISGGKNFNTSLQLEARCPGTCPGIYDFIPLRCKFCSSIVRVASRLAASLNCPLAPKQMLIEF